MSTVWDGRGAGSEGDEGRVCPLSGMVGELGVREMKAGYVDREGWRGSWE